MRSFNSLRLGAMISALLLGSTAPLRGTTSTGTPAPRRRPQRSKHRHWKQGRYQPHQGKQEMQRRRRQMCCGVCIDPVAYNNYVAAKLTGSKT
jgi:hypothetical protein